MSAGDTSRLEISTGNYLPMIQFTEFHSQFLILEIPIFLRENMISTVERTINFSRDLDSEPSR